MSYVDAGYTIALVVLALYALSLVARRRRLERAAARGTAGSDGVLRADAAGAGGPLAPRDPSDQRR